MVALLVKEVATVTSKGQTTLPKTVRQTLGIDAGDKICYQVEKSGRVYVTRVDEEGDPVITSFLSFLANDMAANPQNLRELSPALQTRIKELVGDIDVDLNEAIEGDVAL